MIVDTKQILTVTEVNQNFTRASKVAEKNGKAIIFKNNRPKYMLIDISQSPDLNLTDEEKIDIVAKRVIEKYRPAFLELAK
ncbi:MAG: type II toxin-antitoxin system Phd/YefM family antitoxin [Firmicutes bacterium]|nr:type II toxin-antitoxin system Phd/YefM family antitoxin [Bacillota bacterium]